MSLAENSEAVMRKEVAEKFDCVSCQHRKVDDNKSLEELGFVPSAVGEPLRVKHMCSKKCNGKGFKFCELAAIVADFCRDFCNAVVERHEQTKDGLWAANGSDGLMKRM